MMKTLAVCLIMTLLACGAPTTLSEGNTGEGLPEVLYASDTGGIAEGTPEALGVLKVANTLSRGDLQTAVDLTYTVASNISSYRLGADGKAGTADDEVFDTLRELDDVPYVNTAAFGKLLTYARASGYLPVGPDDPFNPASCTGTQLSQAAIASKFFAPGSTSASVGAYTIRFRRRYCNDLTGCTAWATPTTQVIGLYAGTKVTGQARLNLGGSGTAFSLDFDGDRIPIGTPPDEAYYVSADCGYVGVHPSVTCEYMRGIYIDHDGGWHDVGLRGGASGPYYRLSGVLSNSCLRMSAVDIDTTVSPRVETEMALLIRY